MMYDLSAMEARLHEIDAERGPLVAMIEAARRYDRRGRQIDEAPKEDAPMRRRGSGDNTVQAETEAMALVLIDVNGRPVQTREVIEHLQGKDTRLLPAKNVLNVISARLSNSDKLEGRRGLGWWPKGQPWPDDNGGADVS